MTSCVTHKPVLEFDYLSSNNLALIDAVDYEKRIGSDEKTPDHHISIGTGIYPNEKNYDLATPSTFLRDEGYFETQVEYYYSKSDSSVRVILYEWNKKDLNNFETKKERERKFRKFKNQWDNVSKELNESLGLPTFRQIESDKYGNKIIEDNESIDDMLRSIVEDPTNQSTAWRDDIKWNSKNIHAYLFMFGNNKTGYRQIRLAVYSE